MSVILDEFAAQCHDILKSRPGPDGRREVAALLEGILKDGDFIAAHFNDQTPERKVLYEDRELGFCVLAHGYKGASQAKPHDHGPTWAIYGQVSGETEMTEWAVAEPASADRPGKVKAVETYTLAPGMARVYHEGDLHSPRREDSTRLIRIEGKNLDGVPRLAYEAVGGQD